MQKKAAHLQAGTSPHAAQAQHSACRQTWLSAIHHPPNTHLAVGEVADDARHRALAAPLRADAGASAQAAGLALDQVDREVDLCRVYACASLCVL